MDILLIKNKWGERWDLNPQPPEPQSGALPLSYVHHINIYGVREWIRTTDLQLRRLSLYPTELRGHILKISFYDIKKM